MKQTTTTTFSKKSLKIWLILALGLILIVTQVKSTQLTLPNGNVFNINVIASTLGNGTGWNQTGTTLEPADATSNIKIRTLTASQCVQTDGSSFLISSGGACGGATPAGAFNIQNMSAQVIAMGILNASNISTIMTRINNSETLLVTNSTTANKIPCAGIYQSGSGSDTDFCNDATGGGGGSTQFNSTSTSVYFNDTSLIFNLSRTIAYFGNITTLIGTLTDNGTINKSIDLTPYNRSISLDNYNRSVSLDLYNRSISLDTYNRSIDLTPYNRSISLVNYNQSISLDLYNKSISLDTYNKSISLINYLLGTNTSIAYWNLTSLTNSITTYLLYPTFSSAVVIGNYNTSLNVSSELTIFGSVTTLGSLNATFINATEIRVNGAVVNRSISLDNYNRSVSLDGYNKSISLDNYNPINAWQIANSTTRENNYFRNANFTNLAPFNIGNYSIEYSSSGFKIQNTSQFLINAGYLNSSSFTINASIALWNISSQINQTIKPSIYKDMVEVFRINITSNLTFSNGTTGNLNIGSISVNGTCTILRGSTSELSIC